MTSRYLCDLVHAARHGDAGAQTEVFARLRAGQARELRAALDATRFWAWHSTGPAWVERRERMTRPSSPVVGSFIVGPGELKGYLERIELMISSFATSDVEPSEWKGKGAFGDWRKAWKAWRANLGVFDLYVATASTYDRAEAWEKELREWRERWKAETGQKPATLDPIQPAPPESLTSLVEPLLWVAGAFMGVMLVLQLKGGRR